MLAAIAGLLARGFSRDTAENILSDTVASTRQVYDSKWDMFVQWCKKQEPEIVPEDIETFQLADFMNYLGHTLQLSHQTVAGYRAAIASVLICYDKTHVVQDQTISRLIQCFKRRIRKADSLQLPKWSLPLVLRYLARPPYEPLGLAPIKELTHKTAFLVLLGSGCRRSELHALDRSRLEHDITWTWANLIPTPDFLAKFQARDPDPAVSRVYCLQALSTTTEPEELKSCPMRALRYYIKRTDPVRKGRKRLFLPINKSVKDITANTISWWIKSVVISTYEQSTAQDFQECGIPEHEPDLFRAAHELRAIGSSLSWMNHTTSLTSILQACYWRHHTVFTDHYLRDVTALRDDGLMRLASTALPGSRKSHSPS